MTATQRLSPRRAPHDHDALSAATHAPFQADPSTWENNGDGSDNDDGWAIAPPALPGRCAVTATDAAEGGRVKSHTVPSAAATPEPCHRQPQHHHPHHRHHHSPHHHRHGRQSWPLLALLCLASTVGLRYTWGEYRALLISLGASPARQLDPRDGTLPTRGGDGVLWQPPPSLRIHLETRLESPDVGATVNVRDPEPERVACTTVHDARSVEDVDLSDRLLFLHLGKAGGGAVHGRLRNAWNITYTHCHPSPFRCRPEGGPPAAPRTHRDIWRHQHTRGVVVLNLRDPVERFLSALEWRRTVTCRPNRAGDFQESRSPHTSSAVLAQHPDSYCRKASAEESEILFGARYNRSADALARTLCDGDADRARQAALDTRQILFAGLADWLGPDWLDGRGSGSNATARLFPVVKEEGFDLLAQVDDAIRWIHNTSYFEEDEAFAIRQAHAGLSSDCTDDTEATDPYASPLRQETLLSKTGAACLSRFYATELDTLELVQTNACRTPACRAAIEAILARHRRLADQISTADRVHIAEAIDRSRQNPSTTAEEDVCALLPEAQRKRLEFLHIPKTGGSSVEAVALYHNISWSTCHWLPRILTIPDIPDCPPHPERPSPHHPIYKMSYWHLPPYLVDDGSFTPYEDAQLFAVVRNPYSRIISEWNYLPQMDRNNATALNLWVQKHLREMLNNPNEPYFAVDGHFLQQHLFFHRNYSTILLRQERLKDDFDCLMAMYGLNLTLPERRLNPRQSDARLTARNFSEATVQMIQTVYAQDFYKFGYPVRYGDQARWRGGRQHLDIL